MSSNKKRIALAYILGRLGRCQSQEELEDSDEDTTPQKRSRTAEASSPKRPRKETWDEFEHFAESLAMQLRRLPEIEAVRLMQEMQSLVAERKIELENINNLQKASYDESSDDISEPTIEVSIPGHSTGEDPIDTKYHNKFIKKELDDDDD